MESIETRLTAEDRPRRDHHDDRVARRRAARSRRAGALSYAGSLSLATGTAMIIWLRRAFQAAGTPIRPFTESTVLICHGLYRWSRNPGYLGTVLLAAGVAILLGTLAPLLLVIVVFAILQDGFIRREERLLEDTSATATGHTGARSDDGCRSGARQSTSSLALRRKRGSKEIGGG